MITPVSSIVLVLIASFIGSLAMSCFKAASSHLHFDLKSLVTNWRLGLGILIYLVSSLVYANGIKQGELSILYPMAALGYVWTLFWSRMFFAEPFTKGKFMGIGLILLGVMMLGYGNR